MPFRLFACLALLAALSSLPACAPGPENSTASSTASSGLTGDEAPAPDSLDSSDSAPTGQAAGENAVQLAVADLEQLSEIIKSHAGKVVVVDVWSTSCAPCMREFPHLVALSHTDSEKLACISFNVDYIGLKSKPPESYQAKVDEFLKQQQAERVTNLLSASTDEAVLGEYQLASIPAILIYGTSGQLEHALTDANSGEDGLSYEGDVLPIVSDLLAAH